MAQVGACTLEVDDEDMYKMVNWKTFPGSDAYQIRDIRLRSIAIINT